MLGPLLLSLLPPHTDICHMCTYVHVHMHTDGRESSRGTLSSSRSLQPGLTHSSAAPCTCVRRPRMRRRGLAAQRACARARCVALGAHARVSVRSFRVYSVVSRAADTDITSRRRFLLRLRYYYTPLGGYLSSHTARNELSPALCPTSVCNRRISSLPRLFPGRALMCVIHLVAS